MERIVFLFLIFSLCSCGGLYQVKKPMSHMPIKWLPYFQNMAVVTYNEYRKTCDEAIAIKLTNEKMARIMRNISEKQLNRFEKEYCKRYK